MKIEQIILRRADFPLYQPYNLAFGATEAFEAIVVEVRTDEGARGFSEATIITGYTPESVGGSWRGLNERVGALIGGGLEDIDRLSSELHGSAPFAASALTVAAELAFGVEGSYAPAPLSCDILGLVSAKRRDGIAADIETQLQAGYRTLKVKAGFDAVADLARLQAVQEAVDGRAAIRVDGNQGYSVEEGLKFLAGMDPEGIELVEQLCPANDWQAASRLAEIAEVPLMLDEAIYGPDDIDEAARRRCASFIKTKLLKAGGLRGARSIIEHIRALDMVPVVGNGAAMDLSCWSEAVVCGGDFETAGEMNGFLKSPERLLGSAITFSDGCIHVPPGQPPIDEDRLDYWTLATMRYGTGASRQSGRRRSP